MWKLISKLLGLKTELASDSDVQWRFLGMWRAQWLLILLLAAVVVYYWWQYRKDGRRLTAGKRRLLTALRLAVVGVIVLMIIAPALNIEQMEKRTPVIAVLVDESASMNLPGARNSILVNPGATREDRTRYAEAKEVLNRLVGQMELNKEHRVVVYAYSGVIKHEAGMDLPRLGDTPEQPAELTERLLGHFTGATGEQTHPGNALTRVFDAQANNRLSAVVMIGDCRATDSDEAWSRNMDQAASYFKDRERDLKLPPIPVFTVATGSADPLRDLALRDLAAPPEANMDDVLTMRVAVVNHIEPNLVTELTLSEGGRIVMDKETGRPTLVGGKKKTVRRVRLRSGINNVDISTIAEGPDEGERLYTIEAPLFDDEYKLDNNIVWARVKIVKRTLRCLYIAGKPTIEYHYMWPALVRDPIINVSCWLQDADVNYTQQGNVVIEQLPNTIEEWNKYDVVILYDIDPEKFTNEQETGLEHLIRKGGGLFVVAGRSHGLDSLLTVRTAKMKAMLPVEIDTTKHPDYMVVLDKPIKAVRTKEGRAHPVLMFDMSPDGNDNIWSSFPQFYWAHPTAGVKAQAISLLEKEGAGPDPDGKCLMAIMRYGEGAVFYSGIHEMWRWRFPYENYDYDRFFSQIARYLGETRLMGGQKQVVLRTDPKSCGPGADVQIHLDVLDPALLKQLRNERMLATVTDPEGGTYRAALTLPGPESSTFVGHYKPRRVGEYTVHADHSLAEADSSMKKLFDEDAHFDVRIQSLEELDTTADLTGMARLAAATGGKAYDQVNMKELTELPTKISNAPQLIKHREEEDVWDSPLFLFVLLALVTTEWCLRKKWTLL